LLTGHGKGIAHEFGQAHEDTETHRDTAPEAARNRNSAVDLHIEGEGCDLAAGCFLEKRRRGLADHTLREFRLVVTRERDGVVKLEGQAQAIEAGPEIGSAGRHANLDSRTGHRSFYFIIRRTNSPEEPHFCRQRFIRKPLPSIAG
jgi:hypothetical protein